jgi:signal transduction histidine kinase
MNFTMGLDRLGRGRILVVEDDDDLRPSLVDVLARAGFFVREARHGAQAFELLRSESKPDAILLDLMMPVMDGWEFRARQKRDPELCDTPVVVLTANDTAQAAAIDAYRVLSKPFSLANLVDVVDSVVEHGRQRAESGQDERLAALARLADGVANRINAPVDQVLAVLRSLQEVQSQVTAEPRVRERLRQTILDGLAQTDAVRRMVHDLWAFSRVEDRSRTPVDVRTVLESCITLVVCRTRSRIRIRSDHQNAPPVTANQTRLVTLFSHLIQNAVEAARNEVRTRLYARDQEIVVEVADDGSGMSPSVIRRVFDPFFSTKPVSQGSGLGLSIAHGIASSLGGRIEVESALRLGSIFRVVLPRAVSGVQPRAVS